MLRRFLPIVFVLLAAYGLWVILSGSPAGTPDHRVNLLRRGPTALIQQPGILTPRPAAQWGEYGLTGWSQAETLVRDELRYVETTRATAILDLPTVDKRDRVIELQLFGIPFNPELGAVTVKLNGVGKPEWTIPLSAAFETRKLSAEAAFWNVGVNHLELTVEHVENTLGQVGWDTVALASVRYDEREIAVDVDPYEGRLVLSTGAGVRYTLDARAPAQLLVRGKASGAGSLHFELSFIDPAIGKAGTAQFERDLPVSGEFAETIPLPELALGEVHVAELSWQSDAATTFTVSELALLDSSEEKRPHVLFISIDTLAARHMSVYNYERDTTPRLRALAEDGVVFERAIANAPWTLPSYLSVMTGLYPQAHLMQNIELKPGQAQLSFNNWQLAPNRWTLAEGLHARGYQTAAFVDTAWLSDKFRFAQGFDLFDKSPASYSFDYPDGGIVMIEDHVGQWLDKIDLNSPSFCFIHALDAHGPYLPDAPWAESFHEGWDFDSLVQIPADGAYQTYQQIPRWMALTMVDMTPDAETGKVPDKLFEEPLARHMPIEPIIASYDEAIAKTDEYIGRIIDRLKKLGTYDDTLIVISADHGESFKHDFYSHGRMYEDIIHVPLIVKLPKSEHAGTRVETSVQLVDVYPTILELAGALPHSGLHGRSLTSAFESGELAALPTFSAGGHCSQFMLERDGWKLVQAFPSTTDSAASILTDPRLPQAWLQNNVAGYEPLLDGPFTEYDWKEFKLRPDYGALVQSAKSEIDGTYYELYYLPDDPQELVDRADSEPDKVAELLALIEERRETTQASRDLAQPVQAAPLDAASIGNLKALGYIGDE